MKQKYILYNRDQKCLVSTTVYDSYYEAFKIAEQFNNVIILIVEIL